MGIGVRRMFGWAAEGGLEPGVISLVPSFPNPPPLARNRCPARRTLLNSHPTDSSRTRRSHRQSRHAHERKSCVTAGSTSSGRCHSRPAPHQVGPVVSRCMPRSPVPSHSRFQDAAPTAPSWTRVLPRPEGLKGAPSVHLLVFSTEPRPGALWLAKPPQARTPHACEMPAVLNRRHLARRLSRRSASQSPASTPARPS